MKFVRQHSTAFAWLLVSLAALAVWNLIIDAHNA